MKIQYRIAVKELSGGEFAVMADLVSDGRRVYPGGHTISTIFSVSKDKVEAIKKELKKAVEHDEKVWGNSVEWLD